MPPPGGAAKKFDMDAQLHSLRRSMQRRGSCFTYLRLIGLLVLMRANLITIVDF